MPLNKVDLDGQPTVRLPPPAHRPSHRATPPRAPGAPPRWQGSSTSATSSTARRWPHVVRPSLAVHHDRMRTPVITAVDQHARGRRTTTFRRVRDDRTYKHDWLEFRV